ncbi:MAG TPA: glycosyltransferase family 9 protein [Candidatus Omnitrophota bacterium]|nr:glycosyltransferase family 9 protein [Candidatus Omnitrophota bacterium]
MDQIGDAVMVLPAIQALKDHFPESKIDFLVSSPVVPLASAHPAVSRVYEFRNSYFSPGFSWGSALREWLGFAWIFRKNRYDLAIDFRGDVRNILLIFLAGIPRRIGRGLTGGKFLLTDCLAEIPGEHQIEKNLDCVRILGCETKETAPNIFLPDFFRKDFSTNFYDTLKDAVRPWMVVQAGSGYPSKRWPVGNFTELIGRWLEDSRGTVVLIGGNEETELGRTLAKRGMRVVDLTGKTSFEELCALVDSADIFVGNDSGPAHIAAALGRRTVVLFSGTNEYAAWVPRGLFVSVIRHEVSCAPCHEKICPMPRHDCMEGISVEKVFRCVKGMMNEARK